MKSNKLALISTVLAATILIGAVVIIGSSAKELKLKVKWVPRNYAISAPVPSVWNAEIYFAPPRPLDEIDPTTILLEGTYAPISDPYPSVTSRLIVPFDGYDVLWLVLLKAGHLTPGEYRINLEISGLLDDGTPFAGEGGINLIVPEVNPP